MEAYRQQRKELVVMADKNVALPEGTEEFLFEGAKTGDSGSNTGTARSGRGRTAGRGTARTGRGRGANIGDSRSPAQKAAATRRAKKRANMTATEKRAETRAFNRRAAAAPAAPARRRVRKPRANG